MDTTNQATVTTKRELEQDNKALREALERRKIELDDLNERVQVMEKAVAEQRASGGSGEPAITTLFDPYDETQNPLHIKKHPDGYHLSWKNPNIRNASGSWSGWEPITYDSETGKNLAEYLFAPPAKMTGMATQDNYVRRGTDMVLCRLPIEMWNARQKKRLERAKHNQQVASNTDNTVLRKGVETFGEGTRLKDTSR